MNQPLLNKRQEQQKTELFQRSYAWLWMLFPFRLLCVWFRRRVLLATWLGRLLDLTKTREEAAMAITIASRVLFGEGPRFRNKNKSLYFSDMWAGKVLRYDTLAKQLSVVFQSSDHDWVSGLGWLPDGRMLVASMNSRKLVVVDEKTQTSNEYADLTSVTRYKINDMVVDSKGRAYVGNFGFDHAKLLDACTTTLVSVSDDDKHSVKVQSVDMLFPNGSVVTPDGNTLIVAETFRGQLTAFDIDLVTGDLSNQRIWAWVGAPVDGICLDAEGCVWAAVPQVSVYPARGGVIRVKEGGEIKQCVGFGSNGVNGMVVACMLGTDSDGDHWLYFNESKVIQERIGLADPAKAAVNSVVRAIQVDVGPATSTKNSNYCAGYC